MPTTQYGLEQARIQLPALVAQASVGVTSVITRHGKPVAAVVPMQALEQSLAAKTRKRSCVNSVLSLRGSGKGLWGANPSQTVAGLRNEWEPV